MKKLIQSTIIFSLIFVACNDKECCDTESVSAPQPTNTPKVIEPIEQPIINIDTAFLNKR